MRPALGMSDRQRGQSPGGGDGRRAAHVAGLIDHDKRLEKTERTHKRSAAARHGGVHAGAPDCLLMLKRTRRLLAGTLGHGTAGAVISLE